MDSSQLLKSLNSQNHKKHAKKVQKSIIFHDSDLSASGINEFEKMELPLPPPDAPKFLKDIIKEQEMEGLINSSISDVITKVRKQRQKNAYLIFNDGHLSYLNEIKKLGHSKNPTGALAIKDFMGKRLNNVNSDLQNGKLIINRDRTIQNRDQMELLQELDLARLIKIKDGDIRSKLDLLNIKMQEMEKLDEGPEIKPTVQEINKKIKENLDLASYTLKSEKTKIASDYVKHMGQQRKQMKKRQILREERRRKVEQQRRAEMEEAEEVKDSEKRKQILDRIQLHKRKRQQQQKEMSEKQAQIQQFLKIYKQKVPIFKKKQKQYQDNFIKPEKKYYQQRLKEIKQTKKSYSLNDIVTHQKKYSQIKNKEENRKSQERQLLKKVKVQTKQYYRGSVHSYVEELDRSRRQKNHALFQLGKHRKQRVLEYSKGVVEHHKPKIDHAKRTELLRSLEEQKLKKNHLQKKYRQKQNAEGEELQSYYQEIKPVDRHEEGIKNLQFAKMRKKKFSQSVDFESDINESEKQKVSNLKILRKSQSQLKEDKQETERQIWSLRAKHIEQMSQNLNSPKEFEQIKMNFQNFDRKAAEKESLLKHARMNVEDHIVQKGALDQFYLQSIKQKMKLLD